jgi:hypothetical protein
MPYAKPKQTIAICNRSGAKMLRKDMVEDGYLRGLLVHPDWYDPPHPQEGKWDPEEGIAIWKPAPDLMPTPPSPVAAGNRVGANATITWTQVDPPGSTVKRWEVWRNINNGLGFLKLGTALPIYPQGFFVQGADQIKGDSAAVTGLTFTDTGSAAGYKYYVIAVTYDTSIENTDGLASAPSNTVTVS